MLRRYDEEGLLLLYTKKEIGSLYKLTFPDFVFDVHSVKVSPEELEDPENLGKVVDTLVKAYKISMSKTIYL